MKRFLHIARRLLLWVLAMAVILVAVYAVLRGRGFLLYADEVAPHQWAVFGVDVSAYQGAVDWPMLARQGVDFAFMKATEGSGLQDRCFSANWAGAADAGVRPGAYHFFSYDSPGDTQADNFIGMVPVTAGALPPVVDIEFYGSYLDHPPEREAVRAILDPLLARLEEHYGVKPILYVTYQSYYRYLSGGDFQDYPIWFSSPVVAPVGPWDFWQYSHSGRMEGYSGSEDKIDLNVFRGSAEALEKLGIPAAS